MEVDMVKIYDPAPIYDSLTPGITEWNDARPEIAQALGLSPKKYSDKYAINQVMLALAEQEIPYRDWREIGQHVIDMIRRYPFLMNSYYRVGDTLLPSGIAFDNLVGNHHIDDFPALFGLGEYEGHGLRGAINGRQTRDPRKSYRGFCRSVGLPKPWPDN
ncbi:hypothetical protein IPP92_01010 [Candidatus Saccharibacteria bacterium]|nr:MAG: hypothetical protein IPP92_01010 [Candidatus Saccharibacteria bacterium]